MPLYLEWGPGDAFSTPYSESSKPKAKVNDAPVVAQSKTDDTEESAEEPEPDSILFVKNLNFDTTDETLKAWTLGLGSHPLPWEVIRKSVKEDSVSFRSLAKRKIIKELFN